MTHTHAHTHTHTSYESIINILYRTNEKSPINTTRHIWVIWHTWMRHVPHTQSHMHQKYESASVCENGRVMSHIWMSHVAHVQSCMDAECESAAEHEQCRTLNDVTHVEHWMMSHTWMSHVTPTHRYTSHTQPHMHAKCKSATARVHEW